MNGSESNKKAENPPVQTNGSNDSEAEKAPQKTQETQKTEISIESKKPTSGLSLKSIRQKREMLARQKEVQDASVVEANEPYTEIQVQSAWNEYAKHLKKHGNKILASILETDMPSVADGKIRLKMPNETMKVELLRAQGLMGFIRKKINNTHIELEIEVDETAEKKYAYTSKEKYEKLKEKNPLIEKLRKEFDLDV